MIRDANARLNVLRELLRDGELSTQEDLREKLEKRGFAVNQSTVSRDLKKLAAARTTDAEGRTVYRLSQELEPTPVAVTLGELTRSFAHNGSMIVIHTAVGSASLIARHLDRLRPGGILGTIAGDDTVFVAPARTGVREISATIKAIEASFRES